MRRTAHTLAAIAVAAIAAAANAHAQSESSKAPAAGNSDAPSVVRIPEIPKEPAADGQGQEDFNAALKNLLPLTPDQILAARRRADAEQRAASRPVSGQPPKVIARSVNLSLAPGTPPPVIRTSSGNATAVTFVDSTGQPWSVASANVGNPASFDVDAPNKGGNMIVVTPKSAYAYGNLIISLVNLPTPVVLSVDSGADVVDYRVDIRIAGRGPNARQQIIEQASPEPGDATFMSFLDGVAPQAAKPLKVTGLSPDDTRAWLMGGTIFLRTPATVLSPAWTGSVSSSDGMNVYELPETPVVLVSYAGRMTSVHIEEREQVSQ